MSAAETVRVVTEGLRSSLFDGPPEPGGGPVTPWVTAIVEDHNDPPGDTSPYPGRCLAFTVEVDGLDLRVTVEDVTPDEERPEEPDAGTVVVDFDAWKVGEETMTKTENRLLAVLLERPGRAVSTRELVRAIWGTEATVHTRTISTHVCRMRQRFGLAIECVWGHGYRLSGDGVMIRRRGVRVPDALH